MWKVLFSKVLFPKKRIPTCCIFNVNIFSWTLHFYYRAHNSYVRVSLPPSFSCPCSFSVKGGSGGKFNSTISEFGKVIDKSIHLHSQKMRAGLQIVRKNRTWFYFEIIHFHLTCMSPQLTYDSMVCSRKLKTSAGVTWIGIYLLFLLPKRNNHQIFLSLYFRAVLSSQQY